MTAPRILMVSGNSPPKVDGVGHYTSLLLGALAERRPEWNWNWISRRPERLGSPMIREGGVTLLRPAHTWAPRGRTAASAAAALARPSLIHIQDETHSFHETDAPLGIRRAAERAAGLFGRRRPPCVVTLHEYHLQLDSVAVTRELVRGADRVLCNDRRTFVRCRKDSNREPDRTLWSPANVLPGNRPDPVRELPSPAVITTFGQISPDKNLEAVRAALLLARKTTPLEWQIIGPFDPESVPYHRELRSRFSSDAGPGGWIRFTGGSPDPRDLTLRGDLARTDLMILLFRDGASPRRGSLQAAWAFGCPVLTTPPPEPEPDLREGENLLTTPSESPEVLSESVLRVLTDPALRRTLREGALAAAARFSWEALVTAHLELYDELL